MKLRDWARRTAVLLASSVLYVGCGQNQPPAAGTAVAGVAPGRALLTSVNDLADKRIAVQLGTVYDLYATKTFPKSTILQFPTFQEVTLAVSTGKADAGLSDIDVLHEVMRVNADLVTLGQPIFKSPVAAGFRKADADRRAAFNAFLREIRQNGVWADMADRWMTKRDQRMPALPAAAATRGTVVVGTSSGGFPFAAVQDNELAGFDIELARRFGAHIGAEIRFVDQDFAAHIAALVSGKIDIILASMFDTEERRQRIDFSEAYFEQDSFAFTVKANTAAAAAPPQPASVAPGRARLTSIDDLKDKRVAVQLGTVYDLYASKTFPGATILQFPTFQEVTLAVSTAKADAGLSDIDVLNEVMRVNPELVTLGKPIFKSPVAAGFRKTDAARRAAFNAFLQEIRGNGVWADMGDRWMTKREQKMPELPAGATRGTLVVGTSSGGFPFAAIQNNELAGFDIELARRFGAHAGVEIRFVDQDFAAHIAALVSGKIDVILASMFDTEERRQRIDFSAPYFEQDSYAFTVRANTAAADPGTTAGPGTAAAPEPRSFVESVKASFRSNILVERRYLLIWEGLKTTAVIAVLSTLFGTALGALVCYLRMSPLAVLRVPAKIYIDVVRGIPVLVLLMLIFYVVFASVDISPILVAVLAFGMNFAAYVSEMFRSGIESIDRGQSEAGIAMGFTRTQTFRFIVMPQMIQRILPVYKGEFISMVKMTSIVGYIAVQDLTKASDIIRSRTFDPFFPLIMVAVLYFLIAWVLMQALEYLERVTDPKYRRKAVAR